MEFEHDLPEGAMKEVVGDKVAPLPPNISIEVQLVPLVDSLESPTPSLTPAIPAPVVQSPLQQPPVLTATIFMGFCKSTI